MLFPHLTSIQLYNCTFHQFYTSKCGRGLGVPLPCTSAMTCVSPNCLAFPFSCCLSNLPSKFLHMHWTLAWQFPSPQLLPHHPKPGGGPHALGSAKCAMHIPDHCDQLMRTHQKDKYFQWSRKKNRWKDTIFHYVVLILNTDFLFLLEYISLITWWKCKMYTFI